MRQSVGSRAVKVEGRRGGGRPRRASVLWLVLVFLLSVATVGGAQEPADPAATPATTSPAGAVPSGPPSDPPPEPAATPAGGQVAEEEEGEPPVTSEEEAASEEATQEEEADEEPSEVQLVEPVRVLLDPEKGVGEGLVHLRNESEAEVELRLTAGPLERGEEAEEAAPMVGSVRFATLTEEGDLGRRVFEETLEPGAATVLRVLVSEVWEAEAATAWLLHEGSRVGEIHIELPRLPSFAVRLVRSEDDAPLSIRNGEPVQLTLANDDAVAHPVTWRLSLPGGDAEGSALLPPKSSLRLEGEPPPEGWLGCFFFGVICTDLFHDRTLEGTLELRRGAEPPEGEAGAGAEGGEAGTGEEATPALASEPDTSLPRVTEAVTATVYGWSPSWRGVWSNLILFFVLTLGGVVSIFVNRGLPNRRRRLELKELLGRVATEIRKLSSRIDSYLRLAVRMERKTLLGRLASRISFNPELSAIFKEVESGTGDLQGRLRLLAQVDRLRERLERRVHRELPPILLDRIEDRLGEVVETLGHPSLEEAQLVVLRGQLEEAEEFFDQIDSPPDSLLKETQAELKRLIARLEKLKSAVEAGKAPVAAKVLEKHAKLVAVCEAAAVQESISATEYPRLDADRLRLKLVLEYAEIVERSDTTRQRMAKTIVEEAPKGQAEPEAEKPWWEQSREEHFFEHLGQLSWDHLRQARNMLQQARERIFWKEIHQALVEKRVDVVREPQVVYSDQLVHFSLRFREAELNHAAALHSLGCHWDFGHNDLSEEGWRTSHYYPSRPKFSPEVGFGRRMWRRLLSFLQFFGFPIQDKPREPEVFPLTVTFTDGLGQKVCQNPNDPVSVVKLEEKVKVSTAPRDHRLGERTQIEVIQLSLALAAALAALLGGARDQILKLDLWAGLVAVFLIGFSADTIKNLLVGGSEKDGA